MTVLYCYSGSNNVSHHFNPSDDVNLKSEIKAIFNLYPEIDWIEVTQNDVVTMEIDRSFYLHDAHISHFKVIQSMLAHMHSHPECTIKQAESIFDSSFGF